ncbi:MAG: hypothetical protein A3K46_05360 [Chloroflexi bacterium RBG_13_60_9]|nr:MAG: hypothetical protein A3K46_05360 [Chloroflexi bacterium RBG_13_60_9]
MEGVYAIVAEMAAVATDGIWFASPLTASVVTAAVAAFSGAAAGGDPVQAVAAMSNASKAGIVLLFTRRIISAQRLKSFNRRDAGNAEILNIKKTSASSAPPAYPDRGRLCGEKVLPPY